MTRQLLPISGYTTNPLNEVASPVVGIVEFLEIDFPSPTGNIYLTNAPQSYTWGGNTYSPTSSTGAPFASIQNYAETTDAVPHPMSLQISGVDPTIVQTLVGYNCTWIAITWSLGLMDANNNLVNGTPMFTSPLYLGDATIMLGTNKGSVNINCENLLGDLQNRQSGVLQTEADQQQRWAGDTFFKFCASLTYTFTYWNQLGPSTLGTENGGGDNYGRGQKMR